MSIQDGQPILRSAGTNASPSAIFSPQGTGFVQRDVNPDALVSNQLEDLLAGDSRYITQARRSAQRQAASRGLLNSSIAAGAGEAAAIAAGLPIASADAATVGATDAANMDAENTFLLNQGQWNNQSKIAADNLASASAMARAQMAQNAAELAERARQFDLNRADANAHYDTDWQRQIQGTLLGTALGNMSGMNSALYGTIFSDPTFYNDPEGAGGFANFWTEQFGNLLGGQLTPDFLAGFGINIPGVGGANVGTQTMQVNP